MKEFKNDYLITNSSRKSKNKLPMYILSLSVIILLSYITIIRVAFNDLEGMVKDDIQEQEEKVDVVAKIEVDRVLSSTEFVFKVLYNDGNTIEEKKRPENLDINMTREELKNKYSDWTIESFDTKLVIFSKELDLEAPNYYVISEQDGFIAIFYDDPILGLRLRDVTNRHIEALDNDEQAKIKEGIRVYGEENLIKLLENYTS